MWLCGSMGGISLLGHCRLGTHRSSVEKYMSPTYDLENAYFFLYLNRDIPPTLSENVHCILPWLCDVSGSGRFLVHC